jgi:hypothetical protein
MLATSALDALPDLRLLFPFVVHLAIHQCRGDYRVAQVHGSVLRARRPSKLNFSGCVLPPGVLRRTVEGLSAEKRQTNDRWTFENGR